MDTSLYSSVALLALATACYSPPSTSSALDFYPIESTPTPTPTRSVPRFALTAEMRPVPAVVLEQVVRFHVPRQAEPGFHRGVATYVDPGCLVSAVHVLGDPESVNSRLGGARYAPHEAEETRTIHGMITGTGFLARDVAVLCVDAPLAGLSHANVAASPAEPGDWVYIVLMSERHEQVEYLEAEVGPYSRDGRHFLAGGVATFGDSGGAVFNHHGELVGVVVGGPNSSEGYLSVPFDLLWKDDGGFKLDGMQPVEAQVEGDFIVCSTVNHQVLSMGM
jgi:hypothetical protein